MAIETSQPLMIRSHALPCRLHMEPVCVLSPGMVQAGKSSKVTFSKASRQFSKAFQNFIPQFFQNALSNWQISDVWKNVRVNES